MIHPELTQAIPAILAPLLGTTLVQIHGAEIKNMITERLGHWGARAKRHGDSIHDTGFVEVPTGAKVVIDLHNDHGNTRLTIRDYKHGTDGRPPYASAQERGFAPFVLTKGIPQKN